MADGSMLRSGCAGAVGLLAMSLLLVTSPRLSAQVAKAADPGVRGGTIDAGSPLPGLSAGQSANFAAGLASFVTVRSINGNLPGQPQEGLGPRFNSNSCGSCHSQPATGGTSPSASQFPLVGPNPQVAVATLSGATNRIPYFIQANGPVREARFRHVVHNGFVTNAPDGGVHDLFTVTGRSDATNQAGATGTSQTCSLAQPDF